MFSFLCRAVSTRIQPQHFQFFVFLTAMAVLSGCLSAGVALGAVINVPTTSYPTIQAGINAASSGDTVLVANGTYTGAGNKNLDFGGKAITVKSANGPEKVIIDCEFNGRGFYFHSGELQDSVVSGFTIINGSIYRAGGISIENSSPTITDCVITGNVASGGNAGGIGCYNSSPTIINCVISGNSAHMWGGGVGCFDSSPVIVNCIISDNNSDYYWGGGIVSYNSTPSITNCIISGNSAYYYGGGIYLNGSSPLIKNCTFSENSANEGGGIYSAYSSKPVIINTILWSDYPDEIAENSAEVTVSYSLIDGGWIGEGNIDIYPAYIDFANGDYHLMNYSPCIGAGTPVGAPDADIEGNLRPNPVGSNPDIGAYENSLGIRILPPKNIFGFVLGNQWSYNFNIQRKITKIDQTTFPKSTYLMEILENDVVIGKEWYESTNEQLLFWGTESGGSLYKFDKGLLAAWFPLTVGEKRISSARVVDYPGVTVSMTVNVLSYEKLSLTFGIFDAYRLSYNFTASGPGGTSTQTFDWWVVPYLGVVKQKTPGGEESLISFAIGGGTITQNADTDSDGLKDYLEFIFYNTNPFKSDTDSDGMPDGWEVQYGLNPSVNDGNGDLDGDGFTNIIEYERNTDPNDPDSHPLKAMPWIPLLLLDE